MVFSLRLRRKSAPVGVCPFTSGAAPGPQGPPRPREAVPRVTDRREAERFVRQFHEEEPRAGDAERRVREVLAEIDRTGTYEHTPQELAFGARVAWRNAARCIGRLYWRSLVVRDLRHVSSPTGSPGPASSICGLRGTAGGSGR